jgi:hypothetical protein
MSDVMEMNAIEQAVYAAAFVDAFRVMFEGRPLEERTRLAKAEAAFMIQCFRMGPS